MTTYKEFHARSLSDPSGFWGEQARLIDWHQPFSQVLDYSKPPFAKWFVGGTTNLCHNAIDRHLADARRSDRADLHLDRNRRRKNLHVPPAVPRGQSHGGNAEGARRRARTIACSFTCR